MDNDRAFVFYATTIFAALASVVTASLMAGVAALPTLGVFLSHWALSLGFRLAYKNFDNSYSPIPWFVPTAIPAPAGAPALPTADATVKEEEKQAA